MPSGKKVSVYYIIHREEEATREHNFSNGFIMYLTGKLRQIKVFTPATFRERNK